MTQSSTTINTQSLQQDLNELDHLLHRIRDRLHTPTAAPHSDLKTILKATGGIMKKKISEKEIVEWQRKIRTEWDS